MAEGIFSQNQFSCPVCMDLLKDPVTISCGHSFCMDCITKVWIKEDQAGVYSCPQCRQTFTSRPALYKNVKFAEVIETLGTTEFQFTAPFDCNTGEKDVECDACTGEKCKAVKSCLDCLNSYCQTHLEQHDIFFIQVSKHKLINPTRGLHAMICPKHKKPLEIYCHTDQQCICYPCTMEGHKNHKIVAAVTERTEKQRHLRETQRNFQQRIQEREKEHQELREAVESHKCSAQTAVKGIEIVCTELIHLIKKTRSEVTRLIRDQEKTAVSQAEKLIEQLEQEIDDLRRRDAELEQLSHTDDLISFLQSFQSLSAPPESPVSHNLTVSPLLSYDDVKISVSQLKEKLENFCREEIEKMCENVTHITFIRPNKPKTRNEFLQYFSQFTLDSNTVNNCLRLSDGNRVATNTDTHQQYPDHSERFEYCAQVLCKESVSGRCYWEVEWSGSAGVYISMAYKTISRKSNEEESFFGHNNQSWGVYCHPSGYSTPSSIQQASILDSRIRMASANTEAYLGLPLALVRQTPRSQGQSVAVCRRIADLHVSSSCSRIGVYVDHSAGTLSFYSVSDTMNLIHRVQTTFTQPLYPGFTVCKGSTVKLCHLTERVIGGFYK